MEDKVIMWIISSVASVVVLMLGAIWNEIRRLNEKLQQTFISQAAQEGRLDACEKLIDKLPCVHQLRCPGVYNDHASK